METLYIALVRHTLAFTYHDCQFVSEEFLFVPRFHRNLKMVAFRMSAAKWPGSAALRLVLSIVKRAVRYSLTFGENLTLLLGLLKAQPVCRDDLLEVTSENVGGPPEGTEYISVSAGLSTDENFSAQSLLMTSYWFNLLAVCLPTSRCSSNCAKDSKASLQPSFGHSNSGVLLSLLLLVSELGLPLVVQVVHRILGIRVGT